jgi:hypothetical protein
MQSESESVDGGMVDTDASVQDHPASDESDGTMTRKVPVLSRAANGSSSPTPTTFRVFTGLRTDP